MPSFGSLERAARSTYMEQDDLPPAAQEGEEEGKEEDTCLSVDVVAESDPEDDPTLQELVADLRAGELQACGID